MLLISPPLTPVQNYRLEMRPALMSVMEKTSPGGGFTTYPITTSGEHGFAWNYDTPINRLTVSLQSSVLHRRFNRYGYLERRGAFVVDARATTTGPRPVANVVFNVDLNPVSTAHVSYFPNVGSSGYAFARTTTTDFLRAYIAETSTWLPEPVEIVGETEIITQLFTPEQWSWDGTRWITQYKPVYSQHQFQTRAEATNGTSGNAISVASTLYRFTANDVAQ